MGLSGAPAAGPLAPGQRWSVARKRAVVLRLIAGEPVELVSREIGVPVFKLERWRERGFGGAPLPLGLYAAQLLLNGL